MRNVDASLEAVEEILSALLDISRLDAGATRPQIADFSIADMFRQLEIEFAPTARAKGLALRFERSSVVVRSDRRLMRRLLQNLVSNALKYTPKGRVVVGCRRLVGGQVRIEVWDTGLGIPANQQRLVFEEFQRLEQGARAARGLGLGLSIVERLGRVLGHPIAVRSWPGRGSVFSVVAPRGAIGVAPAAEPGAPEPAVAADALTRPARAGDRQRAARARRHARAADQMGLLASRLRSTCARRAPRWRRSTACPTRSSPTIISTKATACRRSPRCAISSANARRRSSPPPTAASKCAKRRRAPTSRCSTSR